MTVLEVTDGRVSVEDSVATERATTGTELRDGYLEDVQTLSAGLVWLVAGGLAYTLGAVVFIFDSRARYMHFAWHLFVLAGTTCHFFAALWYATPVKLVG